MHRIDVLQVTTLALLGLLFGLFATSCDPDGMVPDDDDVTPPSTDDDDDDADDDDVVSGPASMTLDPTDVDAGAIVNVVATLENFSLGQNATICCTSDDVLLFGFDQVGSTENALLFSFFFGLRSEGTLPWGIDNGNEQVTDDFEVTALPGFDEVGLGAHAADGEVEAGGFAVFHFEITEPNQFVVVQASGLSPEAFHPWIWLLADDGFTGLAAAGFANPDVAGGYDAPITSFFAAEPASYFVRVEDNLFGAGAFSLDVGSVDAADPVLIAEVEPNDETADWQDIGVLGAGVHTITGAAETAGHDPDDNDLNGDLDVFAFRVAEDTVVAFALSFEDGEDFDAVIYDDTAGETELGFGSNQAVSLDMATTANPELVALLLEAGTPYVLGIGNWDGSDGSEWSMKLTVLPSSFPDDAGGDDDDSSAGDDDDSGGDDDDSGGDDDDSGR